MQAPSLERCKGNAIFRFAKRLLRKKWGLFLDMMNLCRPSARIVDDFPCSCGRPAAESSAGASVDMQGREHPYVRPRLGIWREAGGNMSCPVGTVLAGSQQFMPDVICCVDVSGLKSCCPCFSNVGLCRAVGYGRGPRRLPMFAELVCIGGIAGWRKTGRQSCPLC